MKATKRALVFAASIVTASLSPHLASAEWITTNSAPGGDLFLGVAARDKEVVVVANAIDMSTMFTPLRARIYRSVNGGLSFTPIQGQIGQEPSQAGVIAAAIGGESTILVSRGTEVLRTTTAGASWTKHSTGVSLYSLFHKGESTVVGVGSGGAIRRSVDDGVSWTSPSSGTSVILRGQHWQGDIGWAWGYNIEREAGPNDEDIAGAGVLIESRDGGLTWTTLRTFSAVIPGPGWFDSSGAGFFAVSTPASPGAAEARLGLLRTSDGGESFEDVDLPTRVGTAKTPTGIRDIHASYLSLIRAEENNVRLATMAYVAEGYTSSGGPSTKVWDLRLATFLSTNLGETWYADNLGEIEITMTNITSGDGNMAGGKLHHLHWGVMLGQDGRVWRLDTACQTSEDCFSGYTCEGQACIPEDPSDPGEPGDDPGNGEPGNGDPGDDPTDPGDGPGDTNGGDTGDQPGDHDEDEAGCDCGSAGGSAAIAPLVLLLAFMMTRAGRARSL